MKDLKELIEDVDCIIIEAEDSSMTEKDSNIFKDGFFLGVESFRTKLLLQLQEEGYL